MLDELPPGEVTEAVFQVTLEYLALIVLARLAVEHAAGRVTVKDEYRRLSLHLSGRDVFA